jgi:predicted DNA-binding transcriptional regulator AlpA
MAMAAMADSDAKASVIAEELGITTSTLYEYVSSGGAPKKAALDVLETGLEEA